MTNSSVQEGMLGWRHHSLGFWPQNHTAGIHDQLYLRDVGIYLQETSLLISAPKSTVTLFTPDTHHFQTHPRITLEDTQLLLKRSPKILGVIMDPSLSFHKHCNYVTDRIDKRNNMVKALAGSSWGQHNDTLLLTCHAFGKSIASYAAPVWSTNASDSSFKKMTAHNAALRTATGAHKMAIIEHLHQDFLTLKIVEEDHVCNGITTQEPRPRPMKETLRSRHHSTVLPRLGASNKESLQNTHTRTVDSAIQLLGNKSTEGTPTPNSGRGAETEPETTMHSLTTMIRTLSSTAGLQAHGVRRTKRRLYWRLRFVTRRETLVHLQRTTDGLDLRIYGGSSGIGSATSTIETLNDLTTDLIMANTNSACLLCLFTVYCVCLLCLFTVSVYCVCLFCLYYI